MKERLQSVLLLSSPHRKGHGRKAHKRFKPSLHPLPARRPWASRGIFPEFVVKSS